MKYGRSIIETEKKEDSPVTPKRCKYSKTNALDTTTSHLFLLKKFVSTYPIPQQHWLALRRFFSDRRHSLF